MITVLANADLYAPAPRGRVHLVVAGERVVEVVAGDVPTFVGVRVEVVDLDGAVVVPGLVDGHVHVTGGGGEDGPATRVPALPLSAYTTAGVTSVVGLLGTDDAVRTTAELLARVHGLRQEGLSAWALTGGYHLPARTLTGDVQRDLALLEPVVGGGEVAISDHRSSQPTLDELLKLGADAHVGGLLGGKAGVVHLHVGDGERGLDLVRRAVAESELPATTWHPTHVNRRAGLLDEAVDAASTLGLTVDVTAFPVDDDDPAVPAAEAVERLLAAGLGERTTVSSDAGGSLPVFDEAGRVVALDTGSPAHLLRVLGELRARGVPLPDALAPFTTNPARVFGLRGKGVVAAGADADLLVLGPAGDALQVMARGRWHVRDGTAVVRGTFEATDEPPTSPRRHESDRP